MLVSQPMLVSKPPSGITVTLKLVQSILYGFPEDLVCGVEVPCAERALADIYYL